MHTATHASHMGVWYGDYLETVVLQLLDQTFLRRFYDQSVLADSQQIRPDVNAGKFLLLVPKPDVIHILFVHWDVICLVNVSTTLEDVVSLLQSDPRRAIQQLFLIQQRNRRVNVSAAVNISNGNDFYSYFLHDVLQVNQAMVISTSDTFQFYSSSDEL